jgi:hypothetical protein
MFAILGGANCRRHEVDFQDDPAAAGFDLHAPRTAATTAHEGKTDRQTPIAAR